VEGLPPCSVADGMWWADAGGFSRAWEAVSSAKCVMNGGNSASCSKYVNPGGYTTDGAHGPTLGESGSDTDWCTWVGRSAPR